ncbi:NAD(P)H-quinone oxidoreductase [Pontivivens insulae]|uniref:2-haloacrylate reductase n=1 Tax=Pontivivens insulae TaxID=1639689 RepID=A0A2R8ADV4_9RHOB|nr:NAD(P)H-quinone oxidoreductase [Pontivivens insulae]RED14327.1 putative PIG3 family NAD(P)H quinone oxidoreductase [Pontivivens insulae]SPF30404.1 2-haloacrylate reductase [Pontivivens insulae]
MDQMNCVEITKAGGPEVLVPTRRDVPTPGAGEILIRIKAAGVNRPDALQRAGLYDPPADASDLPGLEAAGEVAAIGPNVSRWSVGDAVTALLPGGGYAEYALTRAEHALPVPDGLNWEQAAALCETFFTVWVNVFERAALQAGESLLVHGGSSGIGTTAIQLAAARGARVFTTAGSADKCAACEALGAEKAINYREADFVEEVRAATGKRGVDVILDMVGGDYIPRNIRALAPDGRLSMIAFLGGMKAEVNFAQVMAKRLTVTGSTLRPRSDAFKASVAATLEREVWPLISAGRIGPVMDSSFPLAEAAEAHRRMEASGHIGKIVLVP